MNKVLLCSLVFAVGCECLPSIFNTAEKVLTDEAVKVEIYKDCIPPGDKLVADIQIVPDEKPLAPPHVQSP